MSNHNTRGTYFDTVNIHLAPFLQFDNMVLGEEEWSELLTAIEEKKCTPFIGEGASVKWIPLDNITIKWAEKHGYPLNDSDQLSRVSQFLAISKGGDLEPKKILNAELKKINPPNFSLEEFRNTSYAVLADLNLPIYITTNYDLFLEAALQSRGRNPITEFCRWSEGLKEYTQKAGITSIFDKDTPNKIEPKVDTPLVYHLHGVVGLPQSMVLTERDYIDFVIHMNSQPERKLLPPIIRIALSSTTLLFVGYRLEDINFRVIFQGVIGLVDDFRDRSIAVQLPSGFAEDKKEQALKYLDNYTKNLFKVDLYWGDALEFSAELRKRLDRFRSGMSKS
jgi:hypothetical protein